MIISKHYSMKKTIITLSLLLAVTLSRAQSLGMSCQYFPGLQVGYVKVKVTNNAQFQKYTFAAAVPLLLVDKLANHWYTNIDFSAFYYSATQTNKANDNRVKISKAEGGLVAGRLGYAFGEGDKGRFGFFGAGGLSTSNLDSINRPFKQRSYYNFGGGLIALRKFGKFRVMAKVGYELYKMKNYITKGHGTYFEGTIGYSFYQKYGISVMPCFYSKKMDYMPKTMDGVTGGPANAKVKSFVLRIGLTRFF
ncbi:hypothetical protein CNR22_00330 [Sphingobacteriaceae bacterium]|nr:hypothetical protein CNR22_00330 [Sphingobacteriaceae bacterium]